MVTGPGEWEKEECRVTAYGYRLAFWSDENVQELVVAAAQPCEYSSVKTAALYILKG